MEQQLPLYMGLRDAATFESFIVGSNALAFNSVADLVRGVGEQYLYICAQSGAGKSHLLQAACAAAMHYGHSAAYIPLSSIKKLHSGIIDGLETTYLVCLDDIQAICDHKNWQVKIFHLFNLMRTNNNKLIIAGNVPSVLLNLELADLQSRLGWGVTYQIHSLNDEQKIQALQLRAMSRGLNLDLVVAKFLITRLGRDMSELFATLDLLDKRSLQEKRKLTIPFIKEVLQV